MKLGPNHPMVTFSKLYEKYFASFATANFAVTDAMAQVLRSDFIKDSPVLTLHDRPADLYRPLSNSERIQFLQRYQLLSQHFNEIVDQKARLLVSSTSWTADEDFGLLLKALCSYSASATSSHPHLPELIVLITGKGPQKQQYLDETSDCRQAML
jgi:beta-1,4-mannosyltransferase